MNPNPKGASPAMGAKSGGSSKRMALENLDFHAFSEKVDNLDDEFSIDDDDASTVKPRPELAAAAQPTSGGGGAALSKPPSSSATAESPAPVSATRTGALPAQGGANAANPFGDGRAEHVAGNISAAHGSPQAPAAGESDDPCGETETVATVDRFPQTEVVDTQMLMEDVPPLQMTAPVVQLPSPPAAELPQAPDELMLEAQELPQSPAMQAAGQGDGATLPRSSLMSFDEPIELAAAQTVLPAAPLEEEEERVAAVVPSVRIPSPPSETASGMVTLGAVADAEPDQAEPLQPSAMLAAFGLASPPMSTALLRPFEFAATTGGQQSPEQLAATSARPAPQPVQPPPSGPVLRPPRGEQRVEPAAGGSAEQTLQGLVAPQLSPPKTLDEMSAQLKSLQSDARGQKLRTQMLVNSIVMLASPIHHHKLAERQKKIEEEHEALAAMEQKLAQQ